MARQTFTKGQPVKVYIERDYRNMKAQIWYDGVVVEPDITENTWGNKTTHYVTVETTNRWQPERKYIKRVVNARNRILSPGEWADTIGKTNKEVYAAKAERDAQNNADEEAGFAHVIAGIRQAVLDDQPDSTLRFILNDVADRHKARRLGQHLREKNDASLD